ncbi:src kinase-associated phosphoprotein 2-A-like isoform X2 [Ylistrum balloti]|uniref:src kinase-associated phosphoprotein 2-A-like isoform X2 n=1 Tax=Ylistrum balloti TaxID=509963 RepID=UPI002905D610|nr:src kinase-associated phosphoprotein 2-A-like isoform X2 [Ylistrum balloti]
MALMFENIKNIFGEVDSFLQETLKNEKLSKSCLEHKQSLVDKINKLLDDYPQLAADKTKTDVDKGDESSRTGGSSTTDDGEDPYSDQKFPEVAAADLKDDVISGFLEKKQKKGLLMMAKLQKRWCVIKDDRLYYYEGKKDKKQKGAFCLTGYSFQPAPDLVKEANKKELCFEIVGTGKRSFQFVAHSSDDYNRWKSAIQKVTGAQKLYDDNADVIYEPIEEPLSQEPTQEETAVPEDQEIYDDTAPVPDDNDQETYDDCGGMAAPVVPSRVLPPTTPSASGRKPLPPVPDSQPRPPPKNRSPLPPLPPPKTNVDTPEPKKRKIVNPKEDFENLYYGKWDFSGGTNDELTFKKGDMIHIISKEFDSKSWWIGELQGHYGLVPKLHLVPAYEAASA